MVTMRPRRLLGAQIGAHIHSRPKEDAMNEQLTVPAPIDAYFRTVNTDDVEGFPSLFVEDAVVEDLARMIRGVEAIGKWARRDIFGVRARFELMRGRTSERQTILTVRIEGTFDRKGLPDPLLMDHAFTVSGGKITHLKITFAEPARGPNAGGTLR
jgi:hypothetical protein